MKLLLLITHGLGDWYLPLTMMESFIEKNNIDDLEILVDSIYFCDPGYERQKETGIKLIESVSKNWSPIPREYFGSGDWYGIPDRRIGPQYKDIKNDFLFYRKQCLKDYVKKIYEKKKSDNFRFICGTGMWSYEWNGTENLPLDFSETTPIKLEISESCKNYIDSLVENNSILIHTRLKGYCVSQQYFNEMINYCVSSGISIILIGLKEEVYVPKHNLVCDLRGIISVEETMYLIEKNKHMITSSSMYTFHRFHFNLPTVITTMEHNVDKHYCYLEKDINNSNYTFYDSDSPHLDNIKSTIKVWYNI